MTDHRENTFGFSAKRSALLKALLEEEGIDSSADHYIPRRNMSSPCPLSSAQQRLWFLDQLEPGSSTYNISSAFHLYGAPNVLALEQSLNEIIKRHESLRTTFSAVDGQPLQVVVDDSSFKLPLIDLSILQETGRQSEIHRIAAEEASRPFDLTQGPLFRVTLLKADEEDHVLLLTMHHIISDGWSMGVLFRELSTLYNAFSKGHLYHLPELPIQYTDFAVWQRQWLQGEVLETQLNYWKQKLDNTLPALELPADRLRPAMQMYRGARKSLRLPKSLTAQLKKLSNDEATTLFMTVLAAFQTLLYRYTGQKKILVGSPIANRNRTEIEGLIGFFVNTLVIKTDISGELSFRELLGRVREVALEAYAHQDLPFEKLVEALQPERDLSRSPLIQVMFSLQNAPTKPLELTGLRVSPLAIGYDTAKFDLSLYLWEVEDEIQGSIEYSIDLFDDARIAYMIGHYQTLLESIIANPDQLISKLPLLTRREQHQLLVDWNDTGVDYPKDRCIHELFEEQAKRTPDAIAVVFGEQMIPYQELNRRANQLAHHLRTLGVGPEVLAGICTERSIEMMVGLLGIIKAGGAYVPLDPTYPKDRLAFMLQDSGISVLLTQKRLLAALPEHGAKVICLDSDWKLIAKQSDKNFDSGATVRNLAYVIYTSGSTGRPKGVLGLHRGAINRFTWMWQTYPFEAGEVCCQKTSISFVDSIWEILGPLLKGIKLVIIPDEVVKEPIRFIKYLADQDITRILAVPSYLRVILETHPDLQKRLPKLKLWISSGEILSKELCQRFYEKMPQSLLLNLYGSSEVSADVTWYDTSPMNPEHLSVPIGRPIANIQIYILDPDLQPVPIGVPGELHIGGDGLAAGYLNLSQITENAFIPNPFSDKPDSRLYKTGDNGRWLLDGNIEFIGRVDHQVKIRGFRIEMGEVEAVVNKHPDVDDSVVVAREDRPNEKRLLAYFVKNRKRALTIDALRRYLKQKLPDYMVPSAFVLLDALPLMPNGKVDRRALPAPEKVRQESTESFVKLRDELELQLTKIWEKVLGIKNVGIKNNFFDLGGHSLLAVRLFAQIHKIFGKDLPLATIFQAPTVEQLASVLRQKGWSSPWSSLVPMQPSGSRLPFFCTHGCGGIVFHMHGLVRHLFPEQPFYGLKAQGLESGQAPHTRIEDMAAFYIKEIQTIQPDGPYLIGSSGRGGAIVLEMVQQLKLQGQSVALLVLINPSNLQPVLTHFSFIRSIYGGSLKFFFHRLVDFMHNRPLLPYIKYTFFNRVLVNWRIFQKFVPKNIHREQRFRDVFRDALLKYTPHHVYPGRITCFLYEKSPITPQNRVGDWYDVAGGGLDVRIVPGTFEGMWREPHVQILAEELKACLHEAQKDC